MRSVFIKLNNFPAPTADFFDYATADRWLSQTPDSMKKAQSGDVGSGYLPIQQSWVIYK